MRAHRPNASFSFVYCVWSMGACAPIDQTLRFRQGSVNCVRTFSWGAAAPQTPRDDGLNLARPSAKISPKTKRLVDGRAGAHRPNAIDKRTKNWKSDVKYWTVRLRNYFEVPVRSVRFCFRPPIRVSNRVRNGRMCSKQVRNGLEIEFETDVKSSSKRTPVRKLHPRLFSIFAAAAAGALHPPPNLVQNFKLVRHWF